MITNLDKAKYVLAISGGIDSMVLLDIMLKEGLEVVLAHFNHLTRGVENTYEYQLIKEIAEENNLKLYYKEHSFDDESGNFHKIAHDKRYDFFYDVLKEENCDLVLAHHSDDLIENHIMAYIRGASIKGYGGFLFKSVFHNFNIYRPLINYRKIDIVNYQVSNKIKYLEDSSNNKEDYKRNYIRSKIRDFVREENISSKSNQYANTLLEAYDYIHNEAVNYINKGLHVSSFKELHIVLKKEVIATLLKENELSTSTEIIIRIIDFLNDLRSTKTLDLSKDYLLVKEYDNFYISKKTEATYYENVINETGVFKNHKTITIVSYNKIEKCDKIIKVNYDGDIFPFTLRNRLPGDLVKFSFGKKKLKKLLIDKKIPKLKRDKLLVVEKNNDILFVEDVFQASGKNILYIGIKETVNE